MSDESNKQKSIRFPLGYIFRSSVTRRLWRNSCIVTYVIFPDLAKAFESVPHERLVIEFHSFGIDENY